MRGTGQHHSSCSASFCVALYLFVVFGFGSLCAAKYPNVVLKASATILKEEILSGLSRSLILECFKYVLNCPQEVLSRVE